MKDGTVHDIWTVVIDAANAENPPPVNQQRSGREAKPTLVFTHGYGSASCHFALVFAKLMHYFKIVVFDNLSFGKNSRQGQSSASRQNCDQIEEWLVEYWERWVDACEDLPA